MLLKSSAKPYSHDFVYYETSKHHFLLFITITRIEYEHIIGRNMVDGSEK